MPDVYTTKGWSTLRRAAHKASSISVAERSLTQPRRASGFPTLSSLDVVDVKQHRYLTSPVPSQFCSQCWRPCSQQVQYQCAHRTGCVLYVCTAPEGNTTFRGLRKWAGHSVAGGWSDDPSPGSPVVILLLW